MHLGQEIYSFFYSFGVWGIFGIAIASIFLGVIIYKTLLISKKYNLNNYDELLNKIINNKIIKNIIKIIINIFLISSFYIMIAGFSAYFYQEYYINKVISAVFLVVLCYITFNKNAEKIIQINTILIPIIIIIFIFFGINNINNIENKNIIKINNNFLWIFSGIIYTSYNSITLIGLTGIMSKYLGSKKDCLKVAILTATIFMMLAMIIYLLLINMNSQVEIPMLYIANKFGRLYKILYSIIILIAIFTTAISEGYNFLTNISKNNKKIYKIMNVVMCTLGIPISLVGFANLVNVIYPIFGIIGLFQIITILLFK